MIVYSPSAMLSGSDPTLHTTTRHTGNVSTIDVNPFQTNLIASGAGSSEIFIWDLNAPDKPMTPGQKIQPLSPITRVAWNAKVQHILGTLIGLIELKSYLDDSRFLLFFYSEQIFKNGLH